MSEIDKHLAEIGEREQWMAALAADMSAMPEPDPAYKRCSTSFWHEWTGPRSP